MSQRTLAILPVPYMRASGKEGNTTLFDVNETVRIMQRSALALVECFFQHIRLMLTGDATADRVGVSPIVALSSLLYIADAMAFWYYSNSESLAVIFLLVTIISLVSDSLVCSPYWRTTDRLVSTIACKVKGVSVIIVMAMSFKLNGNVLQDFGRKRD